jgi:hypothetical protein
MVAPPEAVAMTSGPARASTQPLIAGAVFVVLAVGFGCASTAFQEADDVTHYSISRWVFRYPEKIVDIWGRPLVTLFYALPAQLGPTVARTSSALLGVVAAWGAARILRKGGGEHPALAVACTLGLPYVFLQLYGILTELCFAAVLGAGFALYRDRRPRAAALVWSLLPLARPEGFFVGPLLACALAFARGAHPARPGSLPRLSCAALLGAGTLAWWLGGLPVYRRPLWMIEEWPRNWQVDSVYGNDHPLLFLGFLVLVTTPVLFPFLVVGTIRFWRNGIRLEVIVVAFVVLLHSILRTFGLFGSAGYPRYLVTVAPLLGALSGRGIEAAAEAWQSRRGAKRSERAHARIAAAVVAVMVAMILAWPQSGPVHGDSDSMMLARIWPWCAAELAKNPEVRFIADHPFFFLKGDLDRVRNGYPFQRHVVEYADVGSVAIWETKFAGRYSAWAGGKALADLADLETLGFERVPKHQVAGPGPYPWDRPRPMWGDPELENFRWDVLVKRR